MLITQKSSRRAGRMISWLLDEGSDGSVSLRSFIMLHVLGPRSAGAGWGRSHEHNSLNPARQSPARVLQESCDSCQLPFSTADCEA